MFSFDTQELNANEVLVIGRNVNNQRESICWHVKDIPKITYLQLRKGANCQVVKEDILNNITSVDQRKSCFAIVGPHKKLLCAKVSYPLSTLPPSLEQEAVQRNDTSTFEADVIEIHHTKSFKLLFDQYQQKEPGRLKDVVNIFEEDLGVVERLFFYKGIKGCQFLKLDPNYIPVRREGETCLSICDSEYEVLYNAISLDLKPREGCLNVAYMTLGKKTKSANSSLPIDICILQQPNLKLVQNFQQQNESHEDGASNLYTPQIMKSEEDITNILSDIDIIVGYQLHDYILPTLEKYIPAVKKVLSRLKSRGNLLSHYTGRIMIDAWKCFKEASLFPKHPTYFLPELMQEHLPENDYVNQLREFGSTIADTSAVSSLVQLFDIIPLTYESSVLMGTPWRETVNLYHSSLTDWMVGRWYYNANFLLSNCHEKRSFHSQKRKLENKTSEKLKHSNASDSDEEHENLGELEEEEDISADSHQKDAKRIFNQRKPMVMKESKNGKYEGGLVLDAERGKHTRVWIADVVAMYPSIFVATNADISTIPFYQLRDFNYSYVDLKKLKYYEHQDLVLGPVPAGLQSLVYDRKVCKAGLSRLQKESSNSNQRQIKLLAVKIKALKLVANITYGCIGSSYSKFHVESVAEMVTAYGRAILTLGKDIIEGAEFKNLVKVIFGDTDSLVLKLTVEESKRVSQLSYQEQYQIMKSIASTICTRINGLIPGICFAVDDDAFYMFMLLLEKKRYLTLPFSAFLKTNCCISMKDIDTRGINLKQGGVPAAMLELTHELAFLLILQLPDYDLMETQFNIIRMRQMVADLIVEWKSRLQSYEDYTIVNKMSKNPHDFIKATVPNPCLQVARLLTRCGVPVTKNQRVRYVFCKDPWGKDGTQAYPSLMARNLKLPIDSSYYVNHHFTSVLFRLLKGFKNTVLFTKEEIQMFFANVH